MPNLQPNPDDAANHSRGAVILIEITPHRWGWFPQKDQAISYAKGRASFRSGEIRILDSAGKLERTIPFK